MYVRRSLETSTNVLYSNNNNNNGQKIEYKNNKSKRVRRDSKWWKSHEAWANTLSTTLFPSLFHLYNIIKYPSLGHTTSRTIKSCYNTEIPTGSSWNTRGRAYTISPSPLILPLVLFFFSCFFVFHLGFFICLEGRAAPAPCRWATAEHLYIKEVAHRC